MKQLTVLLIDDDAPFRALLRSVFTNHGIRVLEVASAGEADRVLETGEHIDAALVDGLLPDRSGVQWIEGLRSSGSTMKIAFISAFWRDLRSRDHLTGELGVERVFYKPVDPEVVVTEVERWLGREDPKDVASELDRAMAALRKKYAASLPIKLDELARLVGEVQRGVGMASLEPAIVAAHKLRGTAGSYGFGAVGAVAGRIEDALSELRDGDRSSSPRLWRSLAGALEEARAAIGAPDQMPGRRALTSHGGRVLLVDDDPSFLDLMQRAASRNLVELVPAATEGEAIEKASASSFDALLLDVRLASGTSFDLAMRLRELPGYESIPLAFVSIDHSLESRVAAAHAGAETYLQKPLDVNAFVTALQGLLRARNGHRQRVLVVDDDAQFLEVVAKTLEGEKMLVERLQDPQDIFESLEAFRPDLLLLDVEMPGQSGLDVCRAIRMSQEWNTLPIIIVTALTELEDRLAAFKAGGDDYIPKPVLAEELIARVRVRIERAHLLRELADRDPLSGLLNRRAFLEALTVKLDEAARYGHPLTLALIDLDHFKEINDTRGHLAGDRVIAALGNLLNRRFRASDLRCRWGGEEFLIALSHIDMPTAVAVVEKVRQEFAAMNFRDSHATAFSVNLTAGLATHPDDGETAEELLAVADARMYQGKRGGRGTVVGRGGTS